jgi:hypothetical protein
MDEIATSTHICYIISTFRQLQWQSKQDSATNTGACLQTATVIVEQEAKLPTSSAHRGDSCGEQKNR